MTTLRLRLLVCCVLLGATTAFVAPAPRLTKSSTTTGSSLQVRHAAPSSSLLESTSLWTSAAAVDPTAVLSGALGSFLGSPAVLAIPVLAALTVGLVLAWLLVASAAPEVEDDE